MRGRLILRILGVQDSRLCADPALRVGDVGVSQFRFPRWKQICRSAAARRTATVPPTSAIAPAPSALPEMGKPGRMQIDAFG